MEAPVNGIRDTFFRDASLSYQRDAGKSFLYQYFWQDSARDLIEKCLPKSPVEGNLTPKDGPKIKSMLAAAMEQNQNGLRELLLRETPREGKKERRDFWQEMMLNDAGYQAKLISDTDYYIWLVQYLSVRDIFYKDSGPWNTTGPEWLDKLLNAGLGKSPKDPRTKAQTERDLSALAELLEKEKASGTAEAAGRMHNLREPVTREGKVRQLDYLLWLTIRLERAAMHNKIKTWLQDSGYPLRNDGAAGVPKGPRKQDFALRILDAFCDSPEGYTFVPRQDSWMQIQDGWVQTNEGFCVLDDQHVDALLAALKKREARNPTAYIYLPLAIHLQSGCIFFLAGKALYEEQYQQTKDMAVRDAYKQSKELFTFDYFRINTGFFGISTGAGGAPFLLKTNFHKNAGKSYSEVLDDYKRYCIQKALTPMRDFNERAPADLPDLYRWAFETNSETRRTTVSSAKDDFRKSQSKARLNSPSLFL